MKFSRNKYCTYKDLCKALDLEVELKRKQNAQVKKYFGKHPVKGGYQGRILNEFNYLVSMDGKIMGPILRHGKARAKYLEERFIAYHEIQIST